jgi:hypothetical protein
LASIENRPEEANLSAKLARVEGPNQRSSGCGWWCEQNAHRHEKREAEAEVNAAPCRNRKKLHGRDEDCPQNELKFEDRRLTAQEKGEENERGADYGQLECQEGSIASNVGGGTLETSHTAIFGPKQAV